MPLYEYQCDACGRRFERIQRFSEPPAETCTLCGSGPVHKLLSSPAIQFKGSGWYITDYARKADQKGTAKPDGGEGATKEKPTEAKTDTAAKPSSTEKPAKSDKPAKSASTES
jgi:putative FmdB family regulatory protein